MRREIRQCGNCGVKHELKDLFKGFSCDCGADEDYLEKGFWDEEKKAIFQTLK